MRIRDKIMLMFGLGKYVTRAMELKLPVCAADEISDGSGGNRREVRREAACGGRRVQERYIPQVRAGRRVSDTDEPEAELDDEPENEPEGQPEQAEPEEKAGKTESRRQNRRTRSRKRPLDEDVVASS